MSATSETASPAHLAAAPASRLPGTVTIIGDYAFACCRNLTLIMIPDAVAAIESGVFSDCTAVIAVALSATATVADDAFKDCSPNLVITRIPGLRRNSV
jgi:hypothetical protein